MLAVDATEYRFDEFARAKPRTTKKTRALAGIWRLKSVKLCSEIAKRLPKHPSATVFSDRLALQWKLRVHCSNT
jgi:hypothetical protein